MVWPQMNESNGNVAREDNEKTSQHLQLNQLEGFAFIYS